MEIMLDGVQHVVVPIPKWQKFKKVMKIPEPLTGIDVLEADFCWITEEDIIQYMLSCLRAFNLLPVMSIEELGMINTDVITIDTDSPASSAIPLLECALQTMMAVAIVSDSFRETDDPLEILDMHYSSSRPMLVGDLSTQTMQGCNETATAALATLSIKEFVQYVQSAGVPSQYLVNKVVSRMRSKLLKRSFLLPVANLKLVAPIILYLN